MTELLKTMDITPFTQYTAVHLRFGGLIGEEMQIHRYDEMATLHTSLKCARELADANGMEGSDIVLITEGSPAQPPASFITLPAFSTGCAPASDAMAFK
ncbi:MAG: hypothetical protein WDW38_006011 [Sanguina aurantia]